jgi:hypothetical protein
MMARSREEEISTIEEAKKRFGELELPSRVQEELALVLTQEQNSIGCFGVRAG